MTLLMEALRKAEAANRQVQEEQALAAGQAPDPTAADKIARDLPAHHLAPEERGELPRATRDELQDYLDHPSDLDDASPPPIPTLTSPLKRVGPTYPLGDRQAAAAVFSAKGGPTEEDPGRSTRLAVLIGIAILLVPAWFGFNWYLERSTGSSLGLNPAIANFDFSGRSFQDADTTPQNTSAPVMPTNSLAPDPVQPPVTPPTLAMPADVPMEPAAQYAQVTPDAAAPLAGNAIPPPQPTAVTAEPEADSVETFAAARVATLEISRTAVRNTVDPRLQEAYTLFRDGDLATAMQHYQSVISDTPDNRDALLGLAAIALQRQDPQQARSLYARLLELNPRDHLARTGLVQSIGSLSPAEKENTLRDMLSSAPESAPLHFALGNVYAEQQRWQDAQAAYFDALLQARRSSSEPLNPDYAFNLAVSLERLGQSKAALEYYREAQNLARTTRGSFDAALLNQRLATLEQSLP